MRKPDFAFYRQNVDACFRIEWCRLQFIAMFPSFHTVVLRVYQQIAGTVIACTSSDQGAASAEKAAWRRKL